ncbi:MAG: Glutathione S-transferase domain, partial [Polaromonas sp.]|nr:Glutathione S-transferase domain [Polaromonas sp.]
MSLTLYAHPFSSYCQKVLVALWENDTPFAYRHLEEPGVGEELTKLWPIGKFPLLIDEGRTIAETSIIIEHLDTRHPGKVRFLPDDPIAALEVRLLDRFFDQYVMNAATAVVGEALRKTPDRLAEAKAGAAKALDVAYGWLEQRL